ncbi:MAG TPA: NUDIX domain-containing protein [Thermoleophilia bacterium]|nr:NUDIX domain-containing protein [Thermoleophilia bacterium]
MPAPISAGLLMFRRQGDRLEVLLVHPGGPYFARKDRGAWSIPKGLIDAGEDLLTAAQREFTEETGFAPRGPFIPLGGVKRRTHKIVYAWAFEGDCEPADLVSNTFEMEWPPHSGRVVQVPEVDRAAFFGLEEAREAIVPYQRRFLDELGGLLSDGEAAERAR